MQHSLVSAMVLVGGLLVASAPPAFAESKAEALFKKGKKLLAEKSYAAACEAFEDSDKLEPGIGAKLNAAKCFEEWGKLTKAMSWYQDAQAMAAKANDDREPKIKELIAALDIEIPRLTIKVPPQANLEGAGVKLDGAPFDTFGTAVLVDPGPHEVQYNVGTEVRRKTIQLERGSERELTLELPLTPEAQDDQKQRDKQARRSAEAAPPGRMRRLVGLSMAGAGVVGLGVAGYLTLDARSTYKDALERHCNNMTSGCNEEGLQITRDARGQANTATIITVVGLAVAAGGVVLYLTAPEGNAEASYEEEAAAMYLSPVVAPGIGGVVFGGTF